MGQRTQTRLAWLAMPALAAMLALATPARADQLGIDISTDRGNDAVYQPGDPLQLHIRVSNDAYVLAYEIDSEGYVKLLYPLKGQTGLMQANQNYVVPREDDPQQLVVQNPTGQDFLVAIASVQPFQQLPWYLRPYDVAGENNGYVGEPASEEDAVGADGKVAGDPFVAMEKIRRQVVVNPGDVASFATAYTSYYVHEQVRYPRYICNDCHRADHWAWWDGWDPYYTHCSVVDFRVNWGWYWGPAYWTGFVPYFVYVYRPDCPPHWHVGGSAWYSSWDGWTRWTQIWNGPLVRYKSPPPVGYVPPSARQDWRTQRTPPPPGFVVSGVRGDGAVAIGRNHQAYFERIGSVPAPAGRPATREPLANPGVTPTRSPRDAGGVFDELAPRLGRMPAHQSSGREPAVTPFSRPSRPAYDPPSRGARTAPNFQRPSPGRPQSMSRSGPHEGGARQFGGGHGGGGGGGRGGNGGGGNGGGREHR